MSPLSAVPLVALVGFGLYELGFPGVRIFFHYFVQYCKRNSSEDLIVFFFFLRRQNLVCDVWKFLFSVTQVAKCIEIGLPQLIWLIILSQVMWYNEQNMHAFAHFLFTELNHDKAVSYGKSFYIAVPASCDTCAQAHLRPVCCFVFSCNRMALCLLAHSGWCVSACSSENSITLPHRSFRSS